MNTKKLIALFIAFSLSLPTFSQVSGGQITRKSTSKTETVVKSNYSSSLSQNKTKNSKPSPNIQPTSIDCLPMYNVVVGTHYATDKACQWCQLLRDRGYSSQIYWDAQRNLYRIIIGGTNVERDALSLRDISRQTYPDAWILYIVNGKEERYY